MKRRAEAFARALWLRRVTIVAAAGLALGGARAGAQPVPAQRVEGTGLKFPEYYDPPNERQLKTLVQGGKAQPIEGNRVLFTDARVQTYRTTGEPEMEIAAAECEYDPRLKVIHSPGLIRVGTADGNFVITGEGFVWQQTNSTFVISNRVDTLIQPALLREAGTKQGATNLAAGPLQITANRFEYNKETGVGTYRGQVRATGTNFSLAAGLLTTIVPLSETKLDRVRAEQDVVVKYEDLEAAGQHGEYDVARGIARLTGQPTWRAGQRTGRAEELTVDATNRIFRAERQAWVRLPAEGMNGGGFLPGRAPAAPATNGTVEIQSTSYELRTNGAVFVGGVRVEEREGDLLKATMTCRELRAKFANTNQLEQLQGTGGVVIEAEDSRLTAKNATYAATNGLLELTGDPAWRIGTRTGRGEKIFVNALQDEVLVRGEASMRFPAEELAQNRTARPGAARFGTPAGIAAPAAGAAAPEFGEIFADEYRADRTNAHFTGHVRMVHPRMNWSCGRVLVQLPATGVGAGGRIESMLAEDAVVFDLSDGRHQLHGTGDQALYSYGVSGGATNELLRLTGDPVLQSTNVTFRNSVIFLDLAHNRLAAPGQYEIRGPAPANATNLLQFPKR